MIKDIYNLSKNGWYTKLMKFIWGYTPDDFSNFCPFFWLSILNVIIVTAGCIPYLMFLVLKLVFKYIREFCLYLGEIIDAYCERRTKDWLNEVWDKMEKGDPVYIQRFKNDWKFKSRLEREDYHMVRAIDYGSEVYGKYLTNPGRAERIEKMFQKWEEERVQLKQAREKLERELEIKERERREADRLASIKRRQRIAAITIKLKWVFSILGYLLVIAGVLVVGYGLFKLAMWAITWPWKVILANAGKILLILTGVALAVFTVFGIIKGIIWLRCTYGSNCIPCLDRKNKIRIFLSKVWELVTPLFIGTGNGILWLAKGIKEIWDIIMTIKKNNCPGISWIDDDK